MLTFKPSISISQAVYAKGLLCSSLSWFVILNQLDIWSFLNHSCCLGVKMLVPQLLFTCPSCQGFSLLWQRKFVCLGLSCCSSWSSDLFYPARWVCTWIVNWSCCAVGICCILAGALGDCRMVGDTAVNSNLNSCSSVLQYVCQIACMAWVESDFTEIG